MSSYEYNQLLKFLYFEGYADSYEEAEYIIEDMSDEEFEDLNEASKSWSVTKINKFNKEIERQKEQRKKTPNSSLRPGDQAALKRMIARGQSPTKSARKVEPATQEQPRKRTTNLANVKIAEDFDIITEFLFVEGYADTIENAELMAESISAEWVEEILDEAEKVFPLGKVADKMRKVGEKMKSSKSPEEKTKLRTRLDKMGDQYWQPN